VFFFAAALRWRRIEKLAIGVLAIFVVLVLCHGDTGNERRDDEDQL